MIAGSAQSLDEAGGLVLLCELDLAVGRASEGQELHLAGRQREAGGRAFRLDDDHVADEAALFPVDRRPQGNSRAWHERRSARIASGAQQKVVRQQMLQAANGPIAT